MRTKVGEDMLKKIFILIPIFIFGIQEKVDKDSIRFIFEPDSLYLHVGESAEVTILSLIHI